MGDETWTAEELFEGLELAPALVSQLEKMDLLRVVARDGKGEPLYAPHAREELDQVLEFMEMGYELKDIAAIARKVGLPRKKRRLFKKTPVCLQLNALAERSGVELERLQSWVEVGLVHPALTSERGVDLYSVAQVEKVRLLGELEALGANPEELSCAARVLRAFRDDALDHPQTGELPELDTLAIDVERLRVFVGGRQGAIRHWTREIGRLRRKLARQQKATRPRKRKRRRSPTRRT